MYIRKSRMMKVRLSFAITKLMVILSLTLLLTGCWDQVELTERGFVMGVAIDLGDDGQVRLTSQIYKPMQSLGATGGGRQGDAFVNIQITGANIFEAVRDIPNHLGRRAQWSHQRVILIGESYVREHNIQEVLDFFSRDHEPRDTSHIFITEGEASPFREQKPLIESTTSQELKRIQEMTSENSAKTIEVDLFKLNLQLRGQTGSSFVPYIGLNHTLDGAFKIKGMALFKKGKLVDILPPAQTEYLSMLLNQYANPIILVPCSGKVENVKHESVEVLHMRSNMRTKASMDSIHVHFSVQVKGSLNEIQCTDLNKYVDEIKFLEKAEKVLTKHFESLVESLQKKGTDVLGVGNQIYRHNPALWNKLKPDWDEHFQRTRFTYDVQLSLIDTGIFTGESYPE